MLSQCYYTGFFFMKNTRFGYFGIGKMLGKAHCPERIFTLKLTLVVPQAQGDAKFGGIGNI